MNYENLKKEGRKVEIRERTEKGKVRSRKKTKGRKRKKILEKKRDELEKDASEKTGKDEWR